MKQPRREKRRRTKACAGRARKALCAPALQEIEQKLIGLGLDAAAAPGEVVNATVKFFTLLRKRGVTAEQLLRPTRNANGAERVSQPDKRDDFARYGDVIMPFGKHKGLRVLQVWESCPDYLYWCADAWELQSPKTSAAIRRFLKAAEYREAAEEGRNGQ